MVNLENVVPWGRSFSEYSEMFALTQKDFEGRILGCGDGPSSFNAEATHSGYRVVSIDPIYRFDAGEIARRIDETADKVLCEVKKHCDLFVWKSISSPEMLREVRQQAMERFLEDYEAGKGQGRYIEGSLPSLPFSDNAFDLVLSSHLLFLYSENFDLEFHKEAIEQMLRVGKEVRIFPILDLKGRASAFVSPLMEIFKSAGYDCRIEKVAYEFQRGGNRMLKISR